MDVIEYSTKTKPNQKPKFTKTSRKCSQKAFYYFQSFSSNASIDGLKFLGEEGRSLMERTFWMIVISVALILSVILVSQTYIKWMNSPVIVTFSIVQKPIYEIPFPAITICPGFKVDKSVFNFTDVYLKKDNNITLTPYEIMGYDILSLICNPELNKRNNTAFLTDPDTLNFLYAAAPKASEIFMEVQFLGEIIDVTEFSPVLTSEGVCYTFNSMDKSELFIDKIEFPEGFFDSSQNETQWTPESGYKNADMDAYPRRTFLSGVHGGLDVTLGGKKSNLDNVCGGSVPGFKVGLHHPAEISRIEQNYFHVPIDQALVVGIKPKIMTTSSELTSYTPQKRQCYFNNERNLEFFKIYNQRNCMFECLTNYTLQTCGCVNFYMPRINSTPVCGIGNLQCTEEAKVLFLYGEINREIGSGTIVDIKKDQDEFELNYDDLCNCLPSCYSIDFSIESSQSHLNWIESMKVEFQKTSINSSLIAKTEILITNVYLARLIIYFQEMQFTTSERKELYGYTDFWANVGGIIGLFTGFSCITIFEILYYLSLRLICNVRLFGRKLWYGAPKVLNHDVL